MCAELDPIAPVLARGEPTNMRLLELYNDMDVNYQEEEPSGLSKVELQSILASIARGCKQFVGAMQQTNCLLYRGMDYLFPNPWAAEFSKPDRYPSGQSSGQQKTLDDIFKMGGFSSLRRNSISCTPNIMHASGFGVPYMIFPQDGFSFTWSKMCSDIGGDTILGKDINNLIATILNLPEANKDVAPYYAEFLKTWRFSNTDLPAALESGNEISINGHYLALSTYYSNDVAQYFKLELGA